jgi:hypothetical protein
MTRAIELCAPVMVLGRDIYLLQCHLDRNGVASIVLRSMSRVGQVPVKDGSNIGFHAARCHQWIPGNGLARLSGREGASIFSRIENLLFAKTRVLGASRSV